MYILFIPPINKNNTKDRKVDCVDISKVKNSVLVFKKKPINIFLPFIKKKGSWTEEILIKNS